MASVNKVILIGNLGADPELRFTQSGSAVAELRIATSRRWQAKDGTNQEDTQWHRVVVWGKQAEHCKEYLSKGRQVYVEGRLQTRSWEDREGNKRYTTEVVAQSILFMGSGGGARGGTSSFDGGGSRPESVPGGASNTPDERFSGGEIGEDDIPF